MGAKTSLTLGESLDITQCGSLYTRMGRSLQKSSTIELKADAVEKADTAGLQLVLALKNEVANQGGKIIWKRPSDALIDAAKNIGLDDALELTSLS